MCQDLTARTVKRFNVDQNPNLLYREAEYRISRERRMDRKINWYRTPIGKDLLKRLTKRSDGWGLLQTGSFLLIYLVTTYFAYYFFARSLWIPMIAS